MNNKTSSLWTNTVCGDLIFLWIMATTALCAALLINQFRDHPVPLLYQSKAERMSSAVEKVRANDVSVEIEVVAATLPEYLSLEEFQKYVSEKQGLILDARPAIFHRLGHVPGALSLPREDFENAYASLRGQVERNRSRPLIIYCSSSSCEDSDLVRKALLRVGYTNVAIFHGGWSQWTSAGLEEETSQ
jgi:rhodanese-related sulfurtransferase